MNKLVVLGSALIAIALTGCSSAPQTNGETPVIKVGNVDYDSIYHFGYNRGCQSALLQSTSTESLDSMKDKTLNGINAFEDGWRSGTQTCNGGEFKSMYTVGN
ncbi:hypothetical protein [Shewanella sp. UCD-KL21]|uniref:hypothetical protein n=1 Tax=Shewanella sp. UCD-KL21 TaxID=1917164 RepID=UPI000970890C|nr:hypothetical protein [Shewanella sp. UCD-KL21]